MSDFLKNIRGSIERIQIARDTDISAELSRPSGEPERGIPIIVRDIVLGIMNDSGALSTEATNGIKLGHDCVGLIYAREGSTPGGRINLLFPGSQEVREMGPGMRITAPISGSTLISKSANGLSLGRARLVLLRKHGVDYQEPGEGKGTSAPAWQLAGCSISENVRPDTSSELESFPIQGLKRVRIDIDGGATFQSCKLTPWIFCGGQSRDQSTDAIVIPANTDGNAARFRTFFVDVGAFTGLISGASGIPNGDSSEVRMGFQVTDLLPGALTSLNYNVFAID